MTEPEKYLTDAELDRVFRAAREAPVTVPDSLMARMAADAAREHALRSEPVPIPARRSSGWRMPSLTTALHRLGRLILPMGLTASTLMGVWFGGWATQNGLVTTDTLLGSDLAFNLAYQLPVLTDYLVGY